MDFIQSLAALIKAFAKLLPTFVSPQKSRLTTRETEQAIAILTSIPGITPAHHRDFKRAATLFVMRDGSLLKTFKNPAGVDHVFIENRKGEIAFGGFVGWAHSEHLKLAVTSIRQTLTR